MVEHKVHDDPDVPLAGFRDEGFHVLHGAISRIDVVVVGDVIAVVRLGGDVARGQPDSTHAETFQMVQLGGDAVEVPDAVAVGILEAFYIDFVGDGLLPPDEAVVRPDGLGVLRRADGGTVLPVRDHAPAQEQGAGHEQRNERNDPPEFQRNQSFLVLDPKNGEVCLQAAVTQDFRCIIAQDLRPVNRERTLYTSLAISRSPCHGELF